jgi:hypothetical protein
MPHEKRRLQRDRESLDGRARLRLVRLRRGSLGGCVQLRLAG